MKYGLLNFIMKMLKVSYGGLPGLSIMIDYVDSMWLLEKLHFYS